MKVSNTAARIKEYMNLFDYKQVDILNACSPYCKKLGIKLGRNDLSQYISGKAVPRQDKLSVLAAGMEVDEAWLMGYDVPMYIHDSQVGGNVSAILTIDEKKVITAYRGAMPPIKAAVRRLLDVEENADLLPNAAHERTDVQFLGQDREYDEDIMNNPEEWK